MAKRKKKPTKKAVAKAPVIKKVEPSIKAEAKIEKVLEEIPAPTEIVIPVSTKTKPIIEKAIEEQQELNKKKAEKKPKVSKHSFPTKETCKHKTTKRTLGRNSRVMHICTQCGTTVRFGGR